MVSDSTEFEGAKQRPPSWQPGPRSLGPLCAACGAPLRAPGSQCPACGTADDARPCHLMTPFGHGLCAFIGALMLCWALTFALSGSVPRFVLGLGPLALAALAAYAAAQLGRRLATQWRCSYEHVLIGVMVGGPTALTASLVGLDNPEALLLLWLGAATVTYLALRRWGYRPGKAQ